MSSAYAIMVHLSKQCTDARPYSLPPEKDRNFKKTENEALILPMNSQVQENFNTLFCGVPQGPLTECLTPYQAQMERTNGELKKGCLLPLSSHIHAFSS